MQKGKKITTVSEYFASLSSEQAIHLEKLRQVICKHAPDAEEVISYEMPALKYHGILVYYAAFKDHYSLFPKAKALEVFRERLQGYKTTKGTIHFEYGKCLDEKLVEEIIRFNVKENLNKHAAKQAAKSIITNKQIHNLNFTT